MLIDRGDRSLSRPGRRQLVVRSLA